MRRRSRRRHWRRRRLAGGPVTYDDEPPSGSVLDHDADALAVPLLARLKGIVSETGSVLSHLAILAREAGVATVVGYADATRDLPEGANRSRRRRCRPSHHRGERRQRREDHRLARGIGTLVASGMYMVVSLNRWEWNRALFFGLIFLIAEVALATGLAPRRVARLEQTSSKRDDPDVPRARR